MEHYLMDAPSRNRSQRIADTVATFEREVDLWVATASDGTPYLIPLSYLWDGETFLISTPAASLTARNLTSGGGVRLGIGPTRDVILIDATVTTFRADQLASGEADQFATRTGFDPREESNEYVYFRLTPLRIQAWREANELSGRNLMRDGRWLD
jgi:hypothetical protein